MLNKAMERNEKGEAGLFAQGQFAHGQFPQKIKKGKNLT